MLSFALLALIAAFLAGWLSVREVGFVSIVVITPFGVAYWSFARRYSAEHRAEFQASGCGLDDATRKRYRSSIRRYRIQAAALFAVLIYASFASVGKPVWPSILGAAINISMIYACLSAARRLQRKLRESEPGAGHLY